VLVRAVDTWVNVVPESVERKIPASVETYRVPAVVGWAIMSRIEVALPNFGPAVKLVPVLLLT
jgi:hypothetical protein